MERKAKFKVGQQFKTRGKHPRLCTVTDVLYTYNAIAKNKDGLQFLFHFVASNFFDARGKAEAHLIKIIEADALHKKYGPWTVHNIYVGA